MFVCFCVYVFVCVGVFVCFVVVCLYVYCFVLLLALVEPPQQLSHGTLAGEVRLQVGRVDGQ